MYKYERELRVARDELNETEKEAILAEAAEKRQEITQLCHRVVVMYARGDYKLRSDEDQTNPEKTNNLIHQFVEQDPLGIPLTEERRPVMALTLLLKRPLDVTKEFLRLYVPEPDIFDINNEEDILNLPFPSVIGVEHGMPSGEIVRYAITNDEVFEFESAFYDGEQVIKSDKVPDNEAEIWVMIGKRVDSGLPFLVELQENLINMDAVPFNLPEA